MSATAGGDEVSLGLGDEGGRGDGAGAAGGWAGSWEHVLGVDGEGEGREGWEAGGSWGKGNSSAAVWGLRRVAADLVMAPMHLVGALRVRSLAGSV